MKNIKTYISTLLLTLVLGSCQNDEIEVGFNSDPLAVNIHAMVGDNNILSRSNPVGDEAVQTIFNAGDHIAISNGGEYVTYQLDAAGKWQPQAGKYLKWEQETMTFDAYYPVIEGSSISSFTLPADQSSLESIATADYMKVEGVSASKANGDLSLSFVRQMARVTIMIASFGDEYTNDEKTVSGVKLHSAETEIAPYNTSGNGANASFTAIVTPADIAVGNTLISFADGKGNMQVVKAPSTMAPGKSYTYTLHVGKDAATIASVTVEDWTTGETVDGDTEIMPFADPEFVKALVAGPYNVPLTGGIIDPTQPATKAALEAITELKVRYKGIKSLQGIEYMPQLQTLWCNENRLTALDLSQNTKLTELKCSYNNSLTDLNVSQNKNLIILHCPGNSLTTLDVSQNTSLTNLLCSNNSLTTLDVSQNTSLTDLACDYNNLTDLDVSQNTSLTTLDVSQNTSLTDLDVSQNTNLTYLYCYENSLTALDVTDLTALNLGQLQCGNQKENKTLTLTLKNNKPGTAFNPDRDENQRVTVIDNN